MRNLPLLHRSRLHRAFTGTAALALGSVLMLSACSSGGGDKDDKVASIDKNGGASSDAKGGTGGGAAAGEKGDMVKYAQCMRENGVDMPDPSADGMMQAMPAGEAGSAEMAKVEKASEACRKWLPNGGEVTEKQKAEDREKQLKMAKCLREHGLNVNDPEPNGGLAIGIDGDQAKVDEAMKACAGDGTGLNSATVTR
ncbi:hypothetical protein [Yinghuangia soli]|uniref:Uncharacterized protein n=1 Tax=Yinghuangia soli TaxID=2908204 RepID=A0AA41U3C3_9ACTN|nr:hypothetical protein [Yinghuangia soli]MCF2531646.1 hypothetical protein [Yinghuangia soli]